jgi:hypothetical protein
VKQLNASIDAASTNRPNLIASIEEIGCGVNIRAAIESLLFWILNLAEVPLAIRLIRSG